MRALVFTLALLAPAATAGSEFDHAVHWVESQYGVSRVHVPMLGFGMFVASFAGRPFGAKDFKMAIFEGDTRGDRSEAALGDLGHGWRPILRVIEKRGDQVYIYGRDEKDWVQLLMVTASGHDGVVMQFRLRPTRLSTFLAERARNSGTGNETHRHHTPE